ncbi:hypothetical protein [Streptomyces sp. NPDC002685]|uniref:hypothetical protein n=1 Tax=Streptomyces sp. NPDC002685 TaxID=3154540 RepID=UPI00331CAD8E
MPGVELGGPCAGDGLRQLVLEGSGYQVVGGGDDDEGRGGDQGEVCAHVSAAAQVDGAACWLSVMLGWHRGIEAGRPKVDWRA